MILACCLRQNSYCLTIFDMKDLKEASYVLGIQILRDKLSGIMRFSQQTYMERILKRFNMQSFSSVKALIVNGDRFSNGQCT